MEIEKKIEKKIEKLKNILLIQSYVCFGYVGNRAALFALQRLGCEVTAVNTVQFSNHTGYEDFEGDIMPPDHLSRVLKGIERRGVLEDLDAILSGYQGDLKLGQLILEYVEKAKKNNLTNNLKNRAIYCCDPVIGDVGVGRFVKLEVAEFIKNQCVPKADILTPNLYELAYLTGQEVGALQDISAIKAACQELHAKGPRMILVTSILGEESISMMLSCVKKEQEVKTYWVTTPKFDLQWPPSGSGDAVAALFLGHILKSSDPKIALEKTASAIYEIFKATFEAKTRELQFIRAQDLMVSPLHCFRAEEV